MATLTNRYNALTISVCPHTGSTYARITYPISVRHRYVYEALTGSLNTSINEVRKNINKPSKFYVVWTSFGESTSVIPEAQKILKNLMLLSRRTKKNELEETILSLEKQLL